MNNNHACNGVRIALYRTCKVLVPLFIMVVLSMAIIFVGFDNNNIAFASSNNFTDGYLGVNLLGNYIQGLHFENYSLDVSNPDFSSLSVGKVYYYNSNNTTVSLGDNGLSFSLGLDDHFYLMIPMSFDTTFNYTYALRFYNYTELPNVASAMTIFWRKYTDFSSLGSDTLRSYYSTYYRSYNNVSGSYVFVCDIKVDPIYGYPLTFTLSDIGIFTGGSFAGFPSPDTLNVDTYNIGYTDGYVNGISYNSGYQPNAILDFENRFHFNKSLGNISYAVSPSGPQGYVVNNGNANIYYSISYMGASWDYSSSSTNYFPVFVFDLGSKVPRGSTLHFDLSGFGINFYLDGSPVAPSGSYPDLYYNFALFPYSSYNDGVYQSRYDYYSVGRTMYDLELHKTTDIEFDYVMEDNSQYVVFMYFLSSQYVDAIDLWCSSRNNDNYVDNGITYSYTAPYDLHKYSSCQVSSNDYSLGYSNGYVDGEFNGKIIGYNDARDEYLSGDNDYTFRGFFASIINAPVSVITGALDFDFLGFNIKGLILSLLSVIVIIFIIKMFI